MHIAVVHRQNDRSPGFRLLRAFDYLGYETQSLDYHQLPDLRKNIDLVIYMDNAEWEQCNRIKMNDKEVPTFYWAIDTTLDSGNRCVVQSEFVDFVFYAQSREGNKFDPNKSDWLPNAHDSVLYEPKFKKWKDREIDVAFVGEVEKRNERKNLISLIKENFPSVETSNSSSLEEIYELYNNSKIVINPCLGDLNLRMFEGMGSGALLISNPDQLNNLWSNSFVDGLTYFKYQDDNHAIELIKAALSNPQTSERIACYAQSLTFLKHCYTDRAKQILDRYRKLYA